MPYDAATGIRIGATMIVAESVSMNIPTNNRNNTSKIMMMYLLLVMLTRKLTTVAGNLSNATSQLKIEAPATINKHIPFIDAARSRTPGNFFSVSFL